MPALGGSVSTEVRQILEDYAGWQGSLREFLDFEAAPLQLAPTALSTAVLRIFLEEIEQALCRAAPEAPTEARFGAIALLHRCGASVNRHLDVRISPT